MNINCLAVETGSAAPSLALSWQGEKIYRTLPAGRGQAAQHLLPTLHDMLGEVGAQLQQLDALAYGRGPGGFTGLRLGCALVQGLALGSGVKTVGVDSLEAMAYGVSHGVASLPSTDSVYSALTVVNAHGGEIYWAWWERVEGAGRGEKMWQARVPSCCTTVEAMLTSMHALAQSMTGLGNDFAERGAVAERHAARIRAYMSGVVGLGDGFAVYPQLATSLHLPGIDANARPTAEGVLARAMLSLQKAPGEPPENVRLQYLRDKVAKTSIEREAEHRARGAVS